MTFKAQSTSQWQKFKQFEQRRLQNMKQRHVSRRTSVEKTLESAKSFVQEQCEQDIRNALESQVNDLTELLKMMDEGTIE